MKTKICFVITVLIFSTVACKPTFAVIVAKDRCCEYEYWASPDSPGVCICYGTMKNGFVDCGACNGSFGCIETPWEATGNPGYNKRTICDLLGNAVVRYGCAPGYYGVTSNGTTGCTRCPQSGQSAVNSAAITSCYLPSGGSFSDSNGSGTYTGNCYYTN